MQTLQRLEMNDVFDGFAFAKASAGRYDVPDGWYPLLGLPGSLDIQSNTVLFCRLQAQVEAELQTNCLNGVINKLRIHRSAKVNGPNTMLVLASDLMREFEVCQIPLISVENIIEFIDSIRELSNPSTGENTGRSEQEGLSDRYKNFPITVAGADDPIYKGGVTMTSIRKPSTPSNSTAAAKHRRLVSKSPKKG